MQKLFRTIILCCALTLSVGVSAQSMGAAPTKKSKVRLTHHLTRVKGSQIMGNGTADDDGWELKFTFQNTPPKCTKNSLRITIWREKDIFHPKNTTNTGVNWSVLEPMSFCVDPDRPVNPKYYGYSMNDPNKDEEDYKDIHLDFEWGHEGPFSVFLPDYLFMNMPLPDNPEHRTNVPIKYYIAYEVDYGGVLFSTEFATTPSVTYTMYVPESGANIIDRGDRDLSSLFDEDEEEPVDTLVDSLISICSPHKWFMAERTKKGHISTSPDEGGCTWEFDVYNVVEQCSVCGIKKPRPEFERVGSRCLEHDLKEVSRIPTDTLEVVPNGNCIDLYLIYEVTYACQHDCCIYKEKAKESQFLEEKCPPEPPTECKCPPHQWPEEKYVKVDETHEARRINDRICTYYYDIMETPARKCSCCGYEEPARRIRVMTSKKCDVPPPPPPPHKHFWRYYSNTSRIGNDILLSKTPEYDEDSLNISLNDSVQLKMGQWVHRDTICYISSQPVSRQLWKVVLGSDDFMGYPQGDSGLVTDATYQEAYDFIGLLNDTVQQVSNANVLFSLPSLQEMRQLFVRVKAGELGLQAQQLKGFYVDSVEVKSEDNLRVGVLTANDELKSVDVASTPDSIGFLIKAMPYRQVYKKSYGRYRTVIMRKCTKCSKIELVWSRNYLGRKSLKGLTNEIRKLNRNHGSGGGSEVNL